MDDCFIITQKVFLTIYTIGFPGIGKQLFCEKRKYAKQTVKLFNGKVQK